MTRITMTSQDPGEYRAHVEKDGTGSLDHYCDTFWSFMIACGFMPETIDKLIVEWGDSIKEKKDEI